MFPENLLANAKFLVCSPDAAAATTDLDGAVIDMAQDEGYEGICLIAHLGDVTATAAPNLRLMGSAAADGSAPSLENETTALAAAGATNYDDKLIVLDTRGPVNRYVFSRLLRTTANVAVNSVLAILYKARKLPVTQGSDVVASAYDWVISS